MHEFDTLRIAGNYLRFVNQVCFLPIAIAALFLLADGADSKVQAQKMVLDLIPVLGWMLNAGFVLFVLHVSALYLTWWLELRRQAREKVVGLGGV
jgi:ABC-type transport system involved in cytochrome c biogenesis permease subunit